MLQPPTKFEVCRRHIFGFSINRPDYFTFNLLTSILVCIIVFDVSNHPANVGVSGTFRSGLMGQQLSDRPHDLATLTFDLRGHVTCR